MADPGSLARFYLSEDRRVPDDVLAGAYASVRDTERSWIKKNIAQLYALYPPAGRDHVSTRIRWSSGLVTTSTRLVRPWACLVCPAPEHEAGSVPSSPSFSESLAGPAGVAAALVPVMTAGIPEILAILPPSVRQSPHLLTTLELCGLEAIFVVSPEAVASELRTLTAREPAGLILDMAGVASHDPLTARAFQRTMVWSPRLADRFRIWCGSVGQWDWLTLEWSHPHARIEAWGPCRDAAPEHFPRNDGDWGVFCRFRGAALGVGADMLQAPDHSGLPDDALILTPGQEGCWYWPDLDPAFLCFQHGMTLADFR